MRFLGTLGALCLLLSFYFGGVPLLLEAALALPPETSFNRDAGRGSQLFLPIQFADGRSARFLMDTGCYLSMLDKGFEAKLGKRLKQGVLDYGFFGNRQVGFYKEPPLYLSGVRLHTGKFIATDDLRGILGVDGVLGMDCLKNYCLQLDFEKGKIRFLNPSHLPSEALGDAFPLRPEYPPEISMSDFFGLPHGWVAIDTANYYDFALKPDMFQKSLPKIFGAHVSAVSNAVFVPKMVMEGHAYTNLIIDKTPRDFVGLRFLARHLVTLNFPKNEVYLQYHSCGPLANDQYEEMQALGYTNGVPPKDVDSRLKAYMRTQPGGEVWIEGLEFLHEMHMAGLLPGVAKDDKSRPYIDKFEMAEQSESADHDLKQTIRVEKKDDAGLYHYTIQRATKEGPWKIQCAWYTDRLGELIRELPISGALP